MGKGAGRGEKNKRTLVTAAAAANNIGNRQLEVGATSIYKI